MGSERHRQNRHPLSEVRCRAYSPAMSRHTRILDSLKMRQKGGGRVVIWGAGHAKSPKKEVRSNPSIQKI